MAVSDVFAASGITGAAQRSRYAGATASGAPASGVFGIGDFVIDRSGQIWLCTAAGQPGTWAASTAAAVPLTTLGDTLYESASGSARLAGNTASQVKFLSQTGTGTVSAAPAWSVVSGQYLCAPNVYAPGTRTAVTVSSATLAAWSSGNICTGSFTAPAGGSVLVTADIPACSDSVSGDVIAFALAATGTVTPVVGNVFTVQAVNTNFMKLTFSFLVTGLTAGTAYQFDLLGGCTAATTATIEAQGQASTTVTATGGPVTMTVQAV